MVENGPLQQEGVNNAKKVESELKKDKDYMRESLCKSNTFVFVPCNSDAINYFVADLIAAYPCISECTRHVRRVARWIQYR